LLGDFDFIDLQQANESINWSKAKTIKLNH